MSYKDKVKKALELIREKDNNIWNFTFKVPALRNKEVYEVELLDEHLHFDYNNDDLEGEDIEVNLKVEVVNKYQKTRFKINGFSELYITHEEFIPVLDYCDVTESSEVRDIIGFPHIKTLQQFEELYKALTGKELGDD